MFTGTGRTKDIIWNYFSEVKTNFKTIRAKCINCNTEMSALVSRMKTHVHVQERKVQIILILHHLQVPNYTFYFLYINIILIL